MSHFGKITLPSVRGSVVDKSTLTTTPKPTAPPRTTTNTTERWGGRVKSRRGVMTKKNAY